MAAGAAEVVAEAMRIHPWSEALQLTGAGACWCLATTAENEALVVRAGGLALCRANLARFPHNPMLLQQACGAVRNLAVADAHKELFCSDVGASGEDGGETGQTGMASCRALVAALRTHASVAALAQQAAGSVAALAMHGPNKSLLGEAGAIEAVVAAMHAHPGADDAAAQVHEECCAALRNLAANHADNKGGIARCGGIDAIVTSMRTHLHSPINQLHAAGALWNVPANSASNKQLVAACGGVEAILDAIAHHPDDAEVQLECVGSLRNLSTLPQNKPLILQKGAVPAVLATMRRMLDVALLQEQACALLFNLANYPVDAAAAVATLLQHGAPAAVAAVLDAHLASANVVEEAAAALWIMHRAAPGAAWDPQLVALVLRLADQALAAHADHPGALNFVGGMKAEWGAPHSQSLLHAHPTPHSTSTSPAATAAVPDTAGVASQSALQDAAALALLQSHGLTLASPTRQPVAVAERV